MRHFATEIGASSWVEQNAKGPVSVMCQRPKRGKGGLTLVMLRITFMQQNDALQIYRAVTAR